MSIVENLVLIGDELSGLVFDGPAAWARSCDNAQIDESHFLLLRPLNVVQSALKESLKSVEGHAQFSDAMKELVRASARVVLSVETHDTVATSRAIEEFHKALERNSRALDKFGEDYVYSASPIADAKTKWIDAIGRMHVHLRALIDALPAQQQSQVLRKTTPPLLRDQPTAMLSRQQLRNALADIGQLVQSLPPLGEQINEI
jgi:hypothetical protein